MHSNLSRSVGQRPYTDALHSATPVSAAACQPATPPAPIDAAMDDKRHASRQRTFLQGRLYYNNRRASVDCVIRDMSDAGARLQFSSAVTVPEAVELFIPNKDHVWKVRIAWRQDDQLGVCVVDPQHATSQSVSESVEQRVSRLEAELTAMRRLVLELQRNNPSNPYSLL
jgi:hypothetical protein